MKAKQIKNLFFPKCDQVPKIILPAASLLHVVPSSYKLLANISSSIIIFVKLNKKLKRHVFTLRREKSVKQIGAAYLLAVLARGQLPKKALVFYRLKILDILL